MSVYGFKENKCKSEVIHVFKIEGANEFYTGSYQTSAGIIQLPESSYTKDNMYILSAKAEFYAPYTDGGDPRFTRLDLGGRNGIYTLYAEIDEAGQIICGCYDEGSNLATGCLATFTVIIGVID